MSSTSPPVDPSNFSSISIPSSTAPEAQMENQPPNAIASQEDEPVKTAAPIIQDEPEVQQKPSAFETVGEGEGASSSNLPAPSNQALNEAGSSALSATANSALTAALSSNNHNDNISTYNDNDSNPSTPAPSNDKASSSKASPTKRKELVKQIFISSRNFVPLSESASQEEPGAHRAKEGGMKRVDKKKDNHDDSAASAPWLSSHMGDGEFGPSPINNPARKALHAPPVAKLPFDWSLWKEDRPHIGGKSPSPDGEGNPKPTIPTVLSTPRVPPPRVRERCFGLQEAPTFYPRWEEFADPLKYINWAGSPNGGRGREYGIIKIVPPEGWAPSFALDEKRFRFRTRVQRLNSLSADARASLNYLEQLQKFHAQQGRARVSIPVIEGRPINLYELKKNVTALGGIELLSRKKLWGEITRRLGYEDNRGSIALATISSQIKTAYLKIISPFEDFLFKAKQQAASKNHFSGGAAGTPAPSSQDSKDPFEVISESDPLAHYTDQFNSPAPNAQPQAQGQGQGISTPANGTPEPTGASSYAQELLAAGLTPEEVAQAEADARAHAGGGADGKRRSSRKKTDFQPKPPTPATAGAAAPRRRRRDSEEEEDVIVLPGAEEQMCEICMRGDDGTSMLLCDECNRGYHMYCLDPPLSSVPKSQWFCPPCLVGTGNDYGFDDGETHSLQSFWRRAESFRRAWWSERPERIFDPSRDGYELPVSSVSPPGSEKAQSPGADEMDVDSSDKPKRISNGLARPLVGTDLHVSEDDVEREFWRLVSSPNETVEVEYGADVHSTTHGSALPTLETDPINPYSRDAWNLNNLPILPGSLLRYIKSDISGMTVPWIYVGMMFSTFCWHNEDHYTYSINYQHFGDSKTWYGVPGADAEKFEEAMRRVAPDLFETSPDLLFQLVTMMSPDKLKKEGVRVYAADQRANEFIVTFPKSYHAGFNQGFNLNEAVNFAMPDWIEDGLECVRRYQHFAKFPVFSHDELVVTVAQHSSSVATANWLRHAMKEMLDRELKRRDALRSMIPDLQEKVDSKDRPEREYQCAHCNVFCYLAQVTSEKADGVACLEHAFNVCSADVPSNWTLRLRFSDEDLKGLHQSILDRATTPTLWQKKLHKLLTTNPRPPLPALRQLLAEGETIPHPLPEMEQLKEFVERANAWVENALSLIEKKQKRSKNSPTTTRRGSRAAAPVSAAVTPPLEEDEAPKRTLDEVYALLKEGELLPFEAPEIPALASVAEKMQSFSNLLDRTVERIQPNDVSKLESYISVLATGEGLNVKLPKRDILEKHVAFTKWHVDATALFNRRSAPVHFAEADEFVQRAHACGIPDDDPMLVDLHKRHKLGKAWNEKASALLEAKGTVSFEQLKDVDAPPMNIAIDPELSMKVHELFIRFKETTRSIEAVIEETAAKGTVEEMLQPRPAVLRDIRRTLVVLDSTGIDYPRANILRDAIKLHDEWHDELTKILSNYVRDLPPAPKYPGKVASIRVPYEVQTFCDALLDVSDPADDEVPSKTDKPHSRHCVCRTKTLPINKNSAECSSCGVRYHFKCLHRSSERSYDGKWLCSVCAPDQLHHAVPHRKTADLSRLSKLVTSLEYQPAAFRFPPNELEIIRSTVSAADHMVNWAREMHRTTSREGDAGPRLQHLLRRLIANPVDFTVNPEEEVRYDNTMWYSVAKAVTSMSGVKLKATAKSMSPVDSKDVASASGNGRPEEKKRRRGKRAKLVFREETGIHVPSADGTYIYCLCHRAESRPMISCKRCMVWFHYGCVKIPQTSNPESLAGWICPMCCTKTERTYPFAEIRVALAGLDRPMEFLDVRMSLRSEGKPITATQPWTVDASKRILLNLETFYPAIEKTSADAPDPKRQRIAGPEASQSRPPAQIPNHSAGKIPQLPVARAQKPIADVSASMSKGRSSSGSSSSNHAVSSKTPEQLAAEAQERRHRAGMANLYARGVTDAMIKKYYVGWNGKTLVYPRYNANRQLSELDLGARIHLEVDDEDGTRFIAQKIEDERRKVNGLPPLYARKGQRTSVDSTGALVLAQSQSPGPGTPTSRPLNGTAQGRPSLSSDGSGSGTPPTAPRPNVPRTSLPPPAASSRSPLPPISSSVSPAPQAPAPTPVAQRAEMTRLARRMKPNATDEEIEQMVANLLK